MIPNDEPLRTQVINRMLSKLLNAEVYESLTEWEQNFTSSIDSQLSDKRKLSMKQCEILERLYDKS